MRPEDYEKTFKFVSEFLADLNPNFQVDFIRTSFSFSVRIEEYPNHVIVELQREILEDFEAAITDAKYNFYYFTIESNLKFLFYITLGINGFLPDFLISDEIINEKRAWLKNYRCDRLSFNEEMTKVLVEGLKFLLNAIDGIVEKYTHLGLQDIESEREIISGYIGYFEKEGHLNSNGVSIESLSYLKAAALCKISELEKERGETRIQKVIQVINQRIYNIVAELREPCFLDIELPEIMHTIKEYLMETETADTSNTKPEKAIKTDKTLFESLPEDEKYDAAFSLAHEQHTYVDEVYKNLKNEPENIFYYRDEGREIDLWGKNMIEHLQKVYRDLSDHVIIFVSSDYVIKRWARHEWRSIQEAILDRPEEYLLPARFDDTDLPGLHKTIGYIDLSNKSPEVFAEMIIRKIRSAKKG